MHLPDPVQPPLFAAISAAALRNTNFFAGFRQMVDGVAQMSTPQQFDVQHTFPDPQSAFEAHFTAESQYTSSTQTETPLVSVTQVQSPTGPHEALSITV